MAVLLKNPDIKPENINPDEINAIIEYLNENCASEKEPQRSRIQELITEEKVIDKFQKQQDLVLPLEFFKTAAALRATEQDIVTAIMALYQYAITGSHASIESPIANALYGMYYSKLFFKRAGYIYKLITQEARGSSKRKEPTKEEIAEDYTRLGFTEEQAEERAQDLEQWKQQVGDFLYQNDDKIRPYTGGMDAELILYSCELSRNSKNELNLPYIIGILKNWWQAGVTSVKAAHDFEDEYRRKKKEQPTTASTPKLSEQHPEWNYGVFIGGTDRSEGKLPF